MSNQIGFVPDKDARGPAGHHVATEPPIQQAQSQYGTVERGAVGDAVDDAVTIRIR